MKSRFLSISLGLFVVALLSLGSASDPAVADYYECEEGCGYGYDCEEEEFDPTPNTAILFISLEESIYYYGEEGGGSTLLAIAIGEWAEAPAFPQLNLLSNFPTSIPSGASNTGFQWFTLGYYDTLGPNTIHVVTDVPEEDQPPNPIPQDVQDAIGNALGSGALLQGADSMELTTDDLVFFIFANQGDAGASFEDIVEVVTERGFNVLNQVSEEPDQLNAGEGAIFPFQPGSMSIGTLSFQISNQGTFTATFTQAPEPGIVFFFALAALVGWRRWRTYKRAVS